MPIFSNVLSGNLPWFGEQRIRFWSPLDGSWLDASRAVPNLLLGDQDKQSRKFVIVVAAHFILPPRYPNLKGVLEAELAGQPARQYGRLGHNQSDQVVGQQGYPDLFLGHRRCLAAEHL